MADALPLSVVEIRPDGLVFSGDVGPLRRSGILPPENGPWRRDNALRPCLDVPAPDGVPFVEHAELHALLGRLAAEGVLFLERYGDGAGPGELMRMLRADGRVPPFSTVLVRGPGDWTIHEHD